MLKMLLKIAVLGALVGPLAAQEAQIVVLGDSTMAWNEGAVAQEMAATLGEPVRDESVSGARLSHPFALFVGPMDVRSQLPRLPFDWVVIAAGANDLAAECDCGTCDAVLDALITEDAQLGQIPDFVEEVTLRGSKILWATYYDDPAGGGPFGACSDEFAVLDARLATLAGATEGFHLTDMGAAIDAANASLYDPDRVHPSVTGSQAIGRLLAEQLQALSSP